MDFEMRLSGEGLDDLMVTNEELMEASAAVSGLIDSVVHGQHHQGDQEAEDVATTTDVVVSTETTTTATTTTTTTTTTIAIDELDDNKTDEEVEMTESVQESSDVAAVEQMVGDSVEEAPIQQMLPGDAEEGEADEDVEMDETPCTQVMVDEEEGGETGADSVEEEEPSTGNYSHDEEPTSSAEVEAVASNIETQIPSSPKTASSPRKQVLRSPKESVSMQPVEVRADDTAEKQPEEDASAIAQFTKVLGPVWDMLEKQGWQVAQGKDTIFCAMPGTQFFNFRPNINVFDSKVKACWKFVATSAEKTDDIEDEGDDDAALWEILWEVAAQKFAWYTMACGSETLFVKPGTSFTEFQPNETIFQTKKRAVIKCFEIEQVKVELGDSVEGHQVIDFAPKAAKEELVKEEAPASPKRASISKVSAAPTKTPSPALKKDKKAAAASASKASPSAKRSASPSTGSKGKVAAKATPPKSASKTALKNGKKVQSSGKKPTPSKSNSAKKNQKPVEKDSDKAETLSFYIPEFKCTFGIVYKKLQDIGWYHQPGKFEYDYFSPDYTPENAILNGNYFRSAAMFEEYIKDCGLWHKIETELRDEHAETVEQLRIEARKRLALQMERKKKLETLKKQRQLDEKAKTKKHVADAKEEAAKEAAKAKQDAAAKAKLEAAAKTKEQKKSPKSTKSGAVVKKPTTPPTPARRTSSFASDLLGEFKVSMGKMVKKLTQRGWYYRPGRFEYDYFKPGVNAKTAILNEDYFQSEAELETYLKISGLWDDITQELREEFYAEQEQEVMLMSQEEEAAKQAQAQKRKSPSVRGSPAPQQEPPKKPRIALSEESGNRQSSSSTPTAAGASKVAPRVPQIDDEEVEELTNDIWANSHHFEFERR